MEEQPRDSDLQARARLAGVLYLVIILTGLGAEIGLRGQLIDFSDPAGTANAILAAPELFRLAIAADLLMSVCDAGLAVLLFLIFRVYSRGLALGAMVFRLVQTVVIVMGLLMMQAGWLALTQEGASPAHAQWAAMIFFDLHAHGYDLGLVFFGINSLMTAALIVKSGIFARVFAVGFCAAAAVYITGSFLRFFAPAWSDAFAPAYLVCIIAETAFCIRLLLQRG